MGCAKIDRSDSQPKIYSYSQIAFTTETDGNEEIYIMNEDGSNSRNLTNNLAGDGLPSFSPDGSKIAFSSNRDGNWEIYSMNADGTNQRRLTKHSADDLFPDWSPYIK